MKAFESAHFIIDVVIYFGNNMAQRNDQGIIALPQRISHLIDIQCLITSLRFDKRRTERNSV